MEPVCGVCTLTGSVEGAHPGHAGADDDDTRTMRSSKGLDDDGVRTMPEIYSTRSTKMNKAFFFLCWITSPATL